MKKIFIFFILITQIHAFGQSSVLIEPNGGNGILSKNATPVFSVPISVTLPVSGAGTRLMWIPSKSAFRVGTITGTHWDDPNIGVWSFSSGSDTKASGYYSTALGRNTTASGNSSTSMGSNTTASGISSTSMGLYTTANGDYSTSIGYNSDATGEFSSSIGNSNLVNGDYSTSIGNSNLVNGDKTIAIGSNTTAQSFNSTTLGRYNIISGTPTSWVASEPLLIVGNGSDENNANNALTLLKNSYLGLNTATPQYQLTFKDELGDKISLYGGNSTNTTNHYGLGIQSAKLQVFTPTDFDDVVFGYGRSAAFTENVRFKGTGLVGIGVSTPSELLDVNGRMRVRHRPGNTAGVWMSNDVNSTAVGDGAFYGLKSNTEAGIFIGGAWRFSVNNVGDLATVGEINRTQTYTANIVPIAYGNVNTNGTLYTNSSTDNVSVTKTGTGVYQITITGETYNAINYTSSVSLNVGNIFGFIGMGSGSGNLMVYTANSSGVATDQSFTFVVFKK